MTSQRKLEHYAVANLEPARIIAAGTHRYPGVMQEWALLVLAKAGTLPIGNTEQAAESPGPLFRMEAA